MTVNPVLGFIISAAAREFTDSEERHQFAKMFGGDDAILARRHVMKQLETQMLSLAIHAPTAQDLSDARYTLVGALTLLDEMNRISECVKKGEDPWPELAPKSASPSQEENENGF